MMSSLSDFSDLIGQRPDAFDLDIDPVPGLHRPDPGRSPGGDDIAREESHDPGDEPDERGNGENQVAGIR
jgi:hypothetical protein